MCFWFPPKVLWNRSGGETTEWKMILGIRAQEEPLEEKKNERLWDYIIIIFNNLLNKKRDFTFSHVLQETVLGPKYEITW